MSHIAILHPQCVRVGGAIQMALQTAQALQKQGHTVTVYTFEKSDNCFPELQQWLDIRVWQTGKNIWFFPLRKLIVLGTLAWELRHVDMIIANNPPMQIVAAIAKVFVRRIKTVWWHHHIPWYLWQWIMNNDKWIMLSAKRFMEKTFIIPRIDFMVATSYFIAEKIDQYCGREATVIHPIIEINKEKIKEKKQENCSSSSGEWVHCEAGTNEDPGNQANKLSDLSETNKELNTGLDLPAGRQDSRLHGSDGKAIEKSNIITLFTHGRLEAGKGLDMIVRVFEKINKEKIKEKKEGIVSVIPAKAGIQAWIKGNTDDSKLTGLDSRLHGSDKNHINLIVFWTGSLESELREKWIDVRPFDRENTFPELLSGKHGHVLGVYCSEIDGFGMAPLECQMSGISTVILDSAGARETIVTNVTGVPVWYLVDSEEELFRTICHYVQEKMFPKAVSNVNFYHHKDYFTTERLSWDLLSFMSKTQV